MQALESLLNRHAVSSAKLWTHNYAELINFDLIRVVWLMMVMYEIEGVNELGASSAWNYLKFVSTVCFTAFCSEIE